MTLIGTWGIVDNELNMSPHCNEVAKRATVSLRRVSKEILSNSGEVLIPLQMALVRPLVQIVPSSGVYTSK